MAKKSEGTSITLKQPESEFEAIGYFAGAMYFWLTHPLKVTSLVFLGLFGFNAFSVYSNWTSDKAQIEVAKPIGEVSGVSFSLIPTAFASDKRDSIIINGKLWGFRDSQIDAWKLSGEPAVLLHDKDHDVVIKARVDGFDHESMKQFKKGK